MRTPRKALLLGAFGAGLLVLSSCSLLGIVPSIAVFQGSTQYKPGDTFDFGTIDIAGASADFTIKNIGSWGLDLSDSSAVTLSGTGASDFTIDTVPDASIAPGSSGDFSITAVPPGYGSPVMSANVVITAADGTTFTLALSAVGPAG